MFVFMRVVIRPGDTENTIGYSEISTFNLKGNMPAMVMNTFIASSAEEEFKK